MKHQKPNNNKKKNQRNAHNRHRNTCIHKITTYHSSSHHYIDHMCLLYVALSIVHTVYVYLLYVYPNASIPHHLRWLSNDVSDYFSFFFCFVLRRQSAGKLRPGEMLDDKKVRGSNPTGRLYSFLGADGKVCRSMSHKAFHQNLILDYCDLQHPIECIRYIFSRCLLKQCSQSE